MNTNRNITHGPRRPATVLAFVLLAALAPMLAGCVEGSVSLDRIFETFSASDEPKDADTKQAITRFKDTFRTYARADDDVPAHLHHFNDAFVRVRQSYVTPVNDLALIEAAIDGIKTLDEKEIGTFDAATVTNAALDTMLASLDPHSAYLSPEEFKENTVSTRGEFGGLGIEVQLEDGLIKVVSPIEDTPAFRAGIKPGDKITHLDGEAIKGKSLMSSIRVMRGEPGTKIVLTVLRDGVAPFDVTIVRAVIAVRSVRWRAIGDIGYVRVVNFSEKVAPGIEKAMDALDVELGPRMRGMVLDLRSNPGGLLNQSLELTDAFLPEGVIVAVRGRDKADERIYGAVEGDRAHGLPMVVLINGGSASASEIVAGALQDHRRAVVMGQTSFGKGSVQTIMPLPMEGALRLTTQLYYVPSDRSIQGAGIVPDIRIRPKEETKGRREADLPQAIPHARAVTTAEAKAADEALMGAEAEIDEATCPAEKTPRNAEDRVLGCALSYLKAGSTAQFLAALESGGAM